MLIIGFGVRAEGLGAGSIKVRFEGHGAAG